MNGAEELGAKPGTTLKTGGRGSGEGGAGYGVDEPTGRGVAPGTQRGGQGKGGSGGESERETQRIWGAPEGGRVPAIVARERERDRVEESPEGESRDGSVGNTLAVVQGHGDKH